MIFINWKYSEFNPCGKLKPERARTWSSCAALSTKATRTFREALLQQSLAGNKCYTAGERITKLDCQGEEGRAGNNRQSKKAKKKQQQYKMINLSRERFPQHSLYPYRGIHWISLMNSTQQGNGSSSWTSRGKWDGPGITVERKK